MVKYIKNRSDQLRIAKSCHVDPTSGHLGVKKTVGRVKERFMWKGVWDDVRLIVSTRYNNVLYVLIVVSSFLYYYSNSELCRSVHVMSAKG